MTRIVRIALAVALLGFPLGPAYAQDAGEEPEAAEGTPEPGGARGRGPGAEAVAKRTASCRSAATGRNLRGPDLRDAVTICVAEARLDCLKRAVEAKVRRGVARRDYITKCLGET